MSDQKQQNKTSQIVDSENVHSESSINAELKDSDPSKEEKKRQQQRVEQNRQKSTVDQSREDPKEPKEDTEVDLEPSVDQQSAVEKSALSWGEAEKSPLPKEAEMRMLLEETEKSALPEEMGKSALPEEAKQSPLSEETEKSALPEEAKQSPLSEETEKSALPEEAGKSALPEELKQSALSEETEKSALPEEAKQSALSEETEKSALPEEAKQSALSEETEKSALPEEAKQSPLSEETEKCALPEEAGKSALPEELKQSPFSEETEKSALPEEAGKSALPEETEKSALPEETEKSALPEEAGKSAIPEETEKSALPEEAGKSALPEETEKSALPEKAGKSALPEKAGKSALPEKAGKSALPEKAGKSALPEGTEHAVVEQLWTRVGAAVLLIAIGFALYANRFSETQTSDSRSALQIFQDEFKRLQTDFPEQNHNLWLRSGKMLTNHLNKSHPDEPAMIILTAAQDAKRTLLCLGSGLAQTYAVALNSSWLLIHGPSQAQYDASTAKFNIDERLSSGFETEHRAAVLDRLETLPPGSLLILYKYCDHENAAYKNVALVFTVLLEDSSLEPDTPLTELEEKVRDFLWQQFIRSGTIRSHQEMDSDKLSGVWSRISHLVLPVLPVKRIEAGNCPFDHE